MTGREISRNSAGDRYIYDGDQIALVFNGSGVQIQRYLYGDQTDQVLAEEANGQTRWLLADHQGTVRQIVDHAGTLLNQISYDSFGNITNQTNASVTFRFGYTGREWDGETGQYYYRARYYDPKVGRFTSEDPIGFSAGDTNLSRYVFNSPTNFTDPSGMVVWWIPVAAITVISVLAADGIAPNPAQTPTKRCDNDPTDNSGKRALIEAAIGAGPGLIKAAPRIAGAVPGVIRGLPGVADDLGRRLNPSVLDKLRSNPDSGAFLPKDGIPDGWVDLLRGRTGNPSSSSNPWSFNPAKDVDFRGQGKSINDALNEAFKRTGVPRDEFTPTRFGYDAYGKSHPTQYEALKGSNRGAQVNVDLPHVTQKGPEVPHVGYKTPGKQGKVVGHILMDDVPYNR
jgi:RHS repeat-associated protein